MNRVCSKCKIEKDISEFYKYKNDYYYDCKDCYKLCRAKNGHLFRSSKKRAKTIRLNISNLSDGYVKLQLKKGGFLMGNITPELIELKRQLMILNRQIKWQISRT